MNKTANKYLEVTEVAGDLVSQEQVNRLISRYSWAVKESKYKDIVEVACGTGPGLDVLRKISKSFIAGDISAKLVSKVRNIYGKKISIKIFDATRLPFKNNSKDIIIIFEALYYLKNTELFFTECKRVLRKGGAILIVTANKDVNGFNPSPYSHKYYSVPELKKKLYDQGFFTYFYGYCSILNISIYQKLFSPIKKFAIKFKLIPKTMKGKQFLKRIVFGKLVKFPDKLFFKDIENFNNHLIPISKNKINRIHKVIYCKAIKK
jgi:ubiquinone/menaquinone biosynthesis C-methylase UbiE